MTNKENKELEKQRRIQLVKTLEEALFSQGSVKPSEWYLIGLKREGKNHIFECMLPVRGNMRIRIAIYRKDKTTVKYALYRVTNDKDYVHLDNVVDKLPDIPMSRRIQYETKQT